MKNETGIQTVKLSDIRLTLWLLSPPSSRHFFNSQNVNFFDVRPSPNAILNVNNKLKKWVN